MLDARTIKKAAAEAGFDLCGVARSRRLGEAEARFRGWLEAGCHAGLGYLERMPQKRFDPALLVEGARTVIVCGVSYKNEVSSGYPADFPAKVASYACAVDYHTTLRGMLAVLLERLRETAPELAGRGFVDTAPIAEKQWAVEAGLGWIGRQSLLVTPQFGTSVVLGVLVVTDEADRYDSPLGGAGCGACRRCIEACPTGAVGEERMIDARRCIACRTIERTTAPDFDRHGWIFGCEACQQCCPYNRQAPVHRHPAFDPLFDPRTMTPAEWLAMSDEAFAGRFAATPLMRGGAARIRTLLGGDAAGRADATPAAPAPSASPAASH